MDTARRNGSPYRDHWHALPSRRTFLRRAAASIVIAGAAYPRVSRAMELSDHQVAMAPSPAPAPAPAHIANATPAWFKHDVRRMARWLPSTIKTLGIERAYDRRWHALPEDIRATIEKMAIPHWMIALIPADAAQQTSILKQFRMMGHLAGPAPDNTLALRAEQLLIFGGAAQLPTPGDKTTGECLGAEGCTAAMSKYVLAQLKLEFPRELARMSDRLANSQSSVEMKHLFEEAARAGVVKIVRRPFARLRAADFHPGGLTIAQKPGGTHVFGWTRVPSAWNWCDGDKMAVGNTGLPQYGARMILAQEYVTADPGVPGELSHNLHGPITSDNVIYVAGRPDLSDPRTNVYAAQGSDFILISLV